ncbi:hypothetical protein [Microbacterium sp. BH-3-3-3]|uniref:hypothetical protein n=1 Tax=Microbacterium sp. BH-3-3-3 TaxID=1906742 RepID=UPI0011A5D1D7|nr:hypothetical protein [Microbacterium sp. BH-3-3-3]
MNDSTAAPGQDALSPTFSLRRRTVLQGAAWSVPAITMMAVTPAYAASGDRLSFTQVPSSSAACQATSGKLVVHLDSSSSNVGQLVQFTLPSGWSWTNGSGSYVTDSNGDATVPAGDIVVGNRVGTVTASASGQAASADMEVLAAGTIVDAYSSAPSAGDFIRLYNNGTGLVAARSNGDVWARYGNGGWALQGSGGATGAGQMTTVENAARALWIKNGVLELGSDRQPDISSSDNVDFVGVIALGSYAVAVKSNGDVWRGDGTNPWSQVGTGASTGASQIAVLSGQARTTGFWIVGGAIWSEAGAESVGNGQNAGFVRVYAAGGAGNSSPYRDGAVCAITSNGDVWKWISTTGWTQVGSGAQTGIEQGGAFARNFNGSNVGVMWLSGGVLQKSDERPALSAQDNSNFHRLSNWNGSVTISKRDGQQVYIYNSPYFYSRTVDVGTSPGQMAYNGGSGAPIYIKPASC